MNNNIALKVAVAETSVIVRSGLAVVLKRIPNLNVHPVEISTPDALNNYAQLHQPDIVLVNPTFGGWFDLNAFKGKHPKWASVKFVAMVCSVIDKQTLKTYDETLSICDDVDTIAEKLHHLLSSEDEEDKEGNEQEMLSQREKEIITCIVKGMTNKSIADQLCLSVHTVITHRRNITRKLQIHSSAGLTIYAIVNKLVELNEVKL